MREGEKERKREIYSGEDENKRYMSDQGSQKSTMQAKTRVTSNVKRSMPINYSIYFPTLIDAIRKSGGVTMNADLTDIKVFVFCFQYRNCV